MRPVIINDREISDRYPPYVIAEISANHNGSLERAKHTIKAAKDTGASAVKIQSYTPDTMTLDVKLDDFMISEGLWRGRSLYDLYTEAHTPFEWHEELFTCAKSIGITLFSSPFDETSVDLLQSLDAPAYKIASFEIVDLPLISYIAKAGKPMLISTGMATFEEIGQALEAARCHGAIDIALLHCISSYPTPITAANLLTIQKIATEFNLQVGLSDHTIGSTAAIAATALGARLIEKHFTLDHEIKGPDSAFSIQPDAFKNLITATQEAFVSLGQPLTTPAPEEQGNKVFRRSLYYVRDIRRGALIDETDLRRIRPGFGLAPKYLGQVIGKKATRDIYRGERVSWASLEDNTD